MALVTVVSVALIPAMPSAHAAPGSVDPSFGQAGRAQLGLGLSHDRVNPPTELAADPDGGVRVTFHTDSGKASAIPRRYAADGAPDGAYQPLFPPSQPRAVQADGKVVTAAIGADGYFETRLTRFNPDGSRDTTFGEGGFSRPLPSTLFDIAIATSGAILALSDESIAGMHGSPSIDMAVVARFNPDGSPDPGFGTNGVTNLYRQHSVNGFARRIEAQGDRVLLSVATMAGGPEQEKEQILVRLAPNGLLDPSFGSGGAVRPAAKFVDFHVLGGERIAAVLQRRLEAPACCPYENDLALAHYTPDGALDPTFGSGSGQVAFSLGSYDEATAVLWEDDGAVVVGGSSRSGTFACRHFYRGCVAVPALFRLTPEGSPDLVFPGGLAGLGGLVAATPEEEGTIAEIIPRPAGGYFVSGGSEGSAYVAAVGSTGALIPQFAGSGFVDERFPIAAETSVAAVATDSVGRVLVAGTTNAGVYQFGAPGYVARLLPTGGLDLSFNAGKGFARVPFEVEKLVVDSSDRAVVFGDLAGARIAADGQIDRAFGSEGFVVLGSPTEEAQVTAIAALPGDRLLVAGARHGTPFVVRLGVHGRPDPAFGKRGTARLRFGRLRRQAPVERCFVQQVLRQPDGRVLLAGGCPLRRDPDNPGGYVSEVPSTVLGRLLANGKPDRSFGRNGRRVLAGPRSYAEAVALRKGRILVAGRYQRGPRRDTVLYRLRRNGKLDRAFGRRGIVRVPQPKGEGRICGELVERASLLLRPARILLVRNGTGSPVLAFRPNGHRDPAFALGPDIAPDRTPWPGCRRGPYGATQSDGLILAWTSPPTPVAPFAWEGELQKLALGG